MARSDGKQSGDVKPSSRQRAVGWALLCLNFLALGIAVLLFLGLDMLIRDFRAAFCPAKTFLSDSVRVASVFQVALLFPAIGLSYLSVTWSVSRIPIGPRLFHPFIRPALSRPYRKDMRFLRLFTLVLFAISLPIVIVASLFQFCLTDEEILYRRSPWAGFQHYSWGDVDRINTACWRSRGGSSGSFRLTMNDGRSFDILATPGSVAKAYPQIVRALNGRTFAFDASGVAAGCQAPLIEILGHRP